MHTLRPICWGNYNSLVGGFEWWAIHIGGGGELDLKLWELQVYFDPHSGDERLNNQRGVRCKIKDNEKLFGGIQVIFCGDFLQLPPVPNPLYSVEGKYCFQSQIFNRMFPHQVYLNDVVRQTEIALVNAIHKLSIGSLSQNTWSDGNM